MPPVLQPGWASESRTMPGGFPEAQDCIPRTPWRPALSWGCAFSNVTALLTKSRLPSQDSVNRLLLPIMQIRCRFIPTDLASPTKEKGTAASRWSPPCPGAPRGDPEPNPSPDRAGRTPLPAPTLQSRARAPLPSQISNHPTSGSPLV